MSRSPRSVAALLFFALLMALVVGLAAGCGGTTTTTAPPHYRGRVPRRRRPFPRPSAKVYKIGMTQIVSHPTLDVARQAIIDGLKSEGFEDGKNIQIDFQNAEGDMALATSIGQKFANDKKDLIISITTPVSQAMAKTNPDRPIVFCLVTDPVGAGLLKNPDGSRGQHHRGHRLLQDREPPGPHQGTPARGQDHRSALQRRRSQFGRSRGEGGEAEG